MEGDVDKAVNAIVRHLDFYPRPPGGGRPAAQSAAVHEDGDFYPRPPGGGRQPTGLRCKHVTGISIHALRVEGDFLLCHAQRLYEISIHALRVEGD